MYKQLSLAFFNFLIPYLLFCQGGGSPASLLHFTNDPILGKLLPALATYTPENVYLHIDKSICLIGDTIYFKGYVLKGNRLSDNSTSLHVELFDKRGYILQVKVFPIYSGIAIGQLEIPKNAGPDVYYLRAYTKWQCNFNTQKVYQVPITIINEESNNTAVLNHLERNRGIVIGTNCGVDLTCTAASESLYFSILADEKSLYLDSALHLCLISPFQSASVGFTLSHNKPLKELKVPMSSKTAGHGVDILLLSDQKKVIIQEKIFFPSDNLEAEIITDTINTLSRGFNSWRLNVKDTNIANLSISITDAEADTNRITINNSISGVMANYQDIINDGGNTIRYVDSNYIQFTGKAARASNRKIIRNKELLAFITTKDSTRSFKVISIDSTGRFDCRNLFFYDTANVQFQLQDKQFRSKDVAIWFDWFSRPKFFFDSSIYNYSVRSNLQNTAWMKATHWRENYLAYKGKEVLGEVIIKAKQKSPVEKMDEEYTTGAFRGGINSRGFDLINEPSSGMNLATFLQTHMPSIQATDSSITYRGDKFLFFVNEMEVPYDYAAHIPLFEIAYIKVHPPPFVMSFLMQGAVCLYTKKGSELEIPDPTILKNVIVRKMATNKKLDKEYTSGIFSGNADFSLDLRNAQKEFDLFKYLQKKLPGFSYMDMGIATEVKYFGHSIKFFIDEHEVEEVELSMYRYRINFLAYVKVLGTFPDSGEFISAIALYTRKGADVAGAFEGLNKIDLPGYNKIRLPHEFNYNDSSNYSPDNRLTLYWNPLVDSGEKVIRFFNNNYTKKFKVIIEGVGIRGELLHFERVIE